MYSKLFFLVAAVICCINLGYSQAPKEKFILKEANEIEYQKDFGLDFLGRDAQGNKVFYQTYLKSSSLGETKCDIENSLLIYNDQLSRIAEKKIVWPEEQSMRYNSFSAAFNAESFQINGEYYLARSFHKEKTKELILNIYKYDPVGNKLDFLKKITEIPDDKYTDWGHYFTIIASPDSSKWLFYRYYEKPKSKGQEGLFCIMTDNIFNMLWKNEMDIPIEKNLNKYIDKCVSNDGSAHFLFEEYMSVKTAKEEGARTYMNLFTLKNNTSPPLRSKMSLEFSLEITDCRIQATPKGIILGGYFEGARKLSIGPVLRRESDRKGFFMDYFPETGKHQPTHFMDISDQDLAITGAIIAVDPEVLIQFLLPDGQGGFYLTGEKYWVTSGTTSNSTIKGHNADVVVAHFDEELNPDWKQSIQKYCSPGYTGGIFNYCFTRPAGLCCLYDADNDEKVNPIGANMNNNALWLAQIDIKTGQITKSRLLPNSVYKKNRTNFRNIMTEGNKWYFLGVDWDLGKVKLILRELTTGN
jgi:hypothetical protein